MEKMGGKMQKKGILLFQRDSRLFIEWPSYFFSYFLLEIFT